MSESFVPRVAVVGLWHLGSVTSACLASLGIATLGFDPQASVTEGLSRGEPPLHEPGLADLVKAGLAAGRLRFSSDPAALASAPFVWVAWDTPVDDQDRADVGAVLQGVEALFPVLHPEALVIVSSQVPVGSVARLEKAYRRTLPEGGATFASSPENLRLGKAIEVFTRPDRVVFGVRTSGDADRIRELLAPLAAPLEFMRVESAELSKHAINAFLATSVVFINELARLAERSGGDAREVERALKTDVRIGSRAYVKPGGAYAGGTLARDIGYLIAQGQAVGVETPLFDGVRASNDAHRGWALAALRLLLPSLRGARISILGLTYKPGTDTLRRSSAVELCEGLVAEDAQVTAFDPLVRAGADGLPAGVRLVGDASAALLDADAVVVATEWPEFRQITADTFAATRTSTPVLDASGFLATALQGDRRLQYVTVGTAE
ncbi:UDP-glucose dehydrogenase family protein [Luteitalea pratensis]|uniref:UDP-glucose dehydrogenase family protein n=1 Tax=Luteitalea pratensis TaxID=1855912 RepID=UPI0012FFC8E8|nr:nucleotide sugar dehydrogenase [Luteitalea pratensis]